MDEDIWGNDEDDDNKAPNVMQDNDDESNPFSNKYSSNNDDNNNDDMFDNNNNTTKNGNSYNNNNNNINDDPSTNNLLSYFDNSLDGGGGDVRIIDTEERKGKITKYTVYIIESAVFGSSTQSVARRYNDFKWLYSMLGIEFIAIFIPSLPPSNVFERFKDEIISQRRYDLERFLNRINESKILKASSLFELFLSEKDEQIFEEQKKIHNKQLKERSDYDILSVLMRNFQDLDNEEIPEHLTGFNENNENEDDLYLLDIPRVREFFTRCDERFTHLNKVCNHCFEIFSKICGELTVFNETLNGLYEAEYNEKPTLMINSCQERFNIRDFMNNWKEFEDCQMNNFYKYFLLSLRYEHEDIKSILDSFKRYDIIYNKYKKLKISLSKQKEKYPDKDYSDLENSLNETKNLLDLICKIILINQTPKLWNKKIENYNKAIQSYIENVTSKPL